MPLLTPFEQHIIKTFINSLCVHHVSWLQRHKHIKPFKTEDVTCCQYHCCWWLADAKSQSISTSCNKGANLPLFMVCDEVNNTRPNSNDCLMPTRRNYNVIITSKRRRFWRHNGFIIASCARWVRTLWCLWVYISLWIKMTREASWKRTCYLGDFFVTGCTESCHFDQFWCSQWRFFFQNYISVSV